MIIRAIDIRLANDIAELPALSETVDLFAERSRLSGRALYNVHLAIDEFVSNAVLHGYPDRRSGEIAVRLARDEGSLELVLSDDGDPFDPFTAPEPDVTLAIDQRGIGGLGVHLVRTFADDVAYRREDGRNVVTLVLRLPD